jgi:DNA-binding NarL/FixJ family response regulator
MKKILIVDDHPMVVEGLRAIFYNVTEMEVAGTVSNAYEALQFLKTNIVDLVFVDISLPEINGIELCKRIKHDFPETLVLGISTFKERNYISEMIQAGASGYLVKSAAKEEILEAVHAALAGKLYLSVDINSPVMPSKTVGKAPVLTQREKEVLGLIAEGYTNHQMAEKLFISTHTVDSHRKNLLTKFEVKNTASLISLATKMNVLNE